MFNWIGLYLVNELIYQNGTGPMYDVRNTRTLNLSKNAEYAQSIIPDFGLNKMFQTNSTTIAIFLAAAVAILTVSYTHLRQPSDAKPTYWELLRDERGCLCVEMESFALFANAEVLGKNAACLLTISDSFVSTEITTAEQRQKSFTDMMKVALGAEY